MSPEQEAQPQGVLVIAAGGNIGLYASEVKHEWVVRPATVRELEEQVLGVSTDGDRRATGNLVLREGSVKGSSVRVTFDTIRQGSPNTFHEPEDLDSAQVDPSLWVQLAEKIKASYHQYEGFVILHGLDTMAYTAAALSFMLENLAGPVVLTGAQRPLNFGRTDAVQNIVTAITFAASRTLGLTPVPEVCVYCHDTLFRGNRVMMASSSSYGAFDSPNYPALASVGEHVEVQHHLIRPANTVHRLSAKTRADSRVAIVDVFPGMDSRALTTLARTHSEDDEGDRPLRGVLLRTYGMGTAPTSDDSFLAALRSLVEDDVVVLNVTQARSGRISHNIDPVSLRLLEQGVVSGIDMTAEAAYAKMVVVLSNEDPARSADILQIASCGEQSQSIFHWHFAANETIEEKGSFTAPLGAVDAMVNAHQMDETTITYAQLRVLGVEPAVDARKPVVRTIEFKASLIDKQENRSNPIAVLADDTLRWRPDGKRTLNRAYDITSRKDMVIQPGLLLELETSEAIRWTRLAIALYCKTTAETG